MRVALLVLAILSSCAAGPGAATSPALGASPAPASLTTTTLKVSGHPVALHEKVSDAAMPPVILVHGRTWSALPDFDLQVPGESLSLMDALVTAGFSTYAIDLRGYGQTPRDASGWNTPDKAVADLAAAAEHVRARHGRAPAIVGWSYGSMVTQLFVQRNPSAASAVVLYGYPRDPDAVGQASPAAAERKKTTAQAAAEDFLIPGSISAAAIEAYVEASLAADPVRADWTELETWAELDPAAVNVPTLVIHGEKDPYAKPESQAKLFVRLGTADRQWVVLNGGDHAAHLEQTSARFVHAVVAFLRRP